MAGEVVNLREAANLTGWSVKTLRRRCTSKADHPDHIAGAQRVQVGQGAPEWVIPVASLPHRQGTDRVGASASVDRVGNLTAQQGDGVAALAAVISDLTARLAEAQGQVARLTGEAAEARGQVLQLQAGSRSSLWEALRKRVGGSSS